MIFRTRKMVKHNDLNPAGTLFGGRMLEWIDEEAAIYAQCQLDTNLLVTAHMSDINFRSRAWLGDVVEIGVDVVKFGRTSITVKVVVRNKRSQQIIIEVEEMVFVAIDKTGVPVPHGKTTIKG